MWYARWLVFLGAAALACGKTGFSRAAIYYVAPTGGDDTNDGSIDEPFATFQYAISLVMPGDTIYARGGTHLLDSRVTVNSSRSGTQPQPINFLAYPGETPILDFSGMPDSLLGQSMGRGLQINENANWWRVKGLTIQKAKDNGLYNGGSNNIIEQITARWNADSGIQLHDTAADNLVLNSDSYENYDPHNRGENADGFAVKDPDVGPGNIFRGNRAWGNSDDGWDMFEARANGVLIENCWAFENGYDPDPENTNPFRGDANGFKLGHDSGSHVLVRVAAWNHENIGIDVNGNGYIYDGNTPIEPNGNTVKVINSTSYNNLGNYLFDEELPHALRNNVSFEGHDLFAANVAQQLNTWNNIPVDADDFITLDDARSRGPRGADGSLPLSDFLRLKSDSNLVDVGTPLNYAFAGKNYVLQYEGVGPDLGAFEAGSVLPVLPGDYNGDHAVDAADYTVWRNMVGQSGDGLAADGNGDDEVDDEDYVIWKENFGASPGSGSTAVSVAVPEPAGWLLVAMALVRLVVRRSSAR